jgi:hypothetical protein
LTVLLDSTSFHSTLLRSSTVIFYIFYISKTTAFGQNLEFNVSYFVACSPRTQPLR